LQRGPSLWVRRRRRRVARPTPRKGLATVAEALRFKEGDNVVVNDLENPANLYPWISQRLRGSRCVSSRAAGGAVRLDDLEKAVDDKTKAISVSHVEWLTGARHDLRSFAELAHATGRTSSSTGYRRRALSRST